MVKIVKKYFLIKIVFIYLQYKQNRKMNIVIDVSNIYHRSHSAIANSIPGFDLNTKESQHQLVRKFITDSISIYKKFSASNIYFCFDTRSFRKGVDTDYKSNRSHEGKEMFFKVQEDIYNLLTFKGINALRVEGLEADDLVGLVVNKKNTEKHIIVSADEDVQQLITENIHVYKPHSSTRKLYVLNEQVLQNDFSKESIKDCMVDFIDPTYVLIDKFVRGCKGDMVPSLVEKGFRSKRLDVLVTYYKENRKEKHCIDSLKNCLSILNIELTHEQVFERLKLMCLSYEFIPENSFFEFNDINLNNKRSIDITVPAILENTGYYDINFSQKVK